MISRRVFVGTACGAAMAAGVPDAWAADGFSSFLSGVAAQARTQGVSAQVLDRALRDLQPNQKVLELDRAQPEFTQTWAHYRDTRLSPTRIAAGRAAFAQDRQLLDAVRTELAVDRGVIMGVWGLETNYGSFLGGFNVVEALATLAWDGRRASYFRPELLAALGILQHGDVSFEHMLGSYAGAMGQPQFMPTSFRRYAVDFDGDGRRDIWGDRADVLASIANYLGKNGWQAGQPWGMRVQVPDGMQGPGRAEKAPMSSWARRGVRAADGGSLSRSGLDAALLTPGDGDAFLVFGNFAAIRRYNPSDFYALAVGMLGDRIVS